MDDRTRQKVRRGVRLRSTKSVRGELGATYRSYVLGRIDAHEARTRTFLLQTLAASMREVELGGRMAAIEEKIEQLRAEGVIK